jgi:hypothetical protein
MGAECTSETSATSSLSTKSNNQRKELRSMFRLLVEKSPISDFKMLRVTLACSSVFYPVAVSLPSNEPQRGFHVREENICGF